MTSRGFDPGQVSFEEFNLQLVRSFELSVFYFNPTTVIISLLEQPGALRTNRSSNLVMIYRQTPINK